MRFGALRNPLTWGFTTESSRFGGMLSSLLGPRAAAGGSAEAPLRQPHRQEGSPPPRMSSVCAGARTVRSVRRAALGGTGQRTVRLEDAVVAVGEVAVLAGGDG